MAIVFPAHTTNIFQALDLVFFAALKKIKQTVTGEFDENSVREQITTLIQAYKRTATSATIRGSFRRAGLCPMSEIRPVRLEFDEERSRGNPGFRESWERNISDNLPFSVLI
jgi:hypothetical protein